MPAISGLSTASLFDAKSTAPPVYPGEIAEFVQRLRLRGIQVDETQGHGLSPDAQMHDRAATVPAVVVSPRGEWGIVQTLTAMKDLDLYAKMPVSVKSGGHGYFNGATCSGIMVNLAHMADSRVDGDVLTLGPGCVLGQAIDTLARHGKAVPHGDCYGVGAGGHFTTAGWDLVLTRRHGIGCQSVVGGRVVLWDGTVLGVDDEHHPELLYAMRGGAAAGVGVVSEIRLRVVDEPARATWRLTPLTRDQLRRCVANRAFARAASLPEDITLSFRFFFEPHDENPVCSLNIFSLLTVSETIEHLRRHLGAEVASLVDDAAAWSEKRLLDLRLLPASRALSADPGMLSELSSARLHDSPHVFWNSAMVRREMGSSFLETSSHWVRTDCDAMLPEIYARLEAVKHLPMRDRMYLLVVLGGGESLRRQRDCAMPLGRALARFEVHWDHEHEADECRAFAATVADVLRRHRDAGVDRPFRGDIWRPDQAYSEDDGLHAISRRFDRRRGRGPRRVRL
ncbi:FAD/FMN-binding dehydrogenase [Metarhizium robertsii]|uniref:FAD-binding protein n=2 Tax=Metarhizium robertsii TaxID=568076 RepID=E9F601_METRA|nr:FAD-binding protein [Metarhizium robertsii ARSEF 23]EFY96887.2 FAD-binding protein [Metarhizium robertsii ARSEF 23]EXU99902.1 FAD/FMN-binding dehydrogenase [Metarhizium robertsii]